MKGWALIAGYEIREVTDGGEEEAVRSGGMGDVIADSLNRFRQQFPLLSADPAPIDIHNKVVNFILPLAGRFETFQRFIRNYEQVSLTASNLPHLFFTGPSFQIRQLRLDKPGLLYKRLSTGITQ